MFRLNGRMRFVKHHIKGYELNAKSIRSCITEDRIRKMEAVHGESLRKGGDEYGIVDDHTCFGLFVYDGEGKTIQRELFSYIENFRKYFDSIKDPGLILTGANKILCERNKSPESSIYGTAFLGLFFEDGNFLYSTAGHEMPFLLKADGTIEQLSLTDNTSETNSFMMLGLDEKEDYKTFNTLLNSGDILIIYSDGLTDAHPQNSDQIFYSDKIMNDLKKLHEEIKNGGNFRNFSKSLLQKSLDFSGINPPKDDTTVVVVRRT